MKCIMGFTNNNSKAIHVSCYIPNVAHFKDKHFTMILWPQCSFGTSGPEHLSTASSFHKENKVMYITHTHTIYTDVMAT